MLTLNAVCRSVGDFAMQGISFNIAQGDYAVILGPTGCGKTVLLETIAGIGRPDSGTIHMAGENITRKPPEKRNIGFVYQRSMLFPHYSVERNIRYGMRLRGVPARKQADRLATLAEMLGIGDLLGRDVANLSGGESQKVALARALAIEPPLLLLDEPLAPLDPPSRENLRNEIIKMHRELGTTIVHVTHDQLTARILATKIGVMSRGGLQQFGDADDLFHRPASEFVARFVGMENVYCGYARRLASGAQVEVDGLVLRTALDVEGRVGVCISPEMIHLPAADDNGSANSLPAVVREVSDRGAAFRVVADVEGRPFVANVSRRDYERQPIAPGAQTTLGFAPENVHCFSRKEGVQ